MKLEINILKGELGETKLPPIEAKIMRLLLDFPKDLFITREKILRDIWDNKRITDNALTKRMSQLRKAIKKVTRGTDLRTVYGSGYRLVKIKPRK